MATDKFVLPTAEEQEEHITEIRQMRETLEEMRLGIAKKPEGYAHSWDSLQLAHGRGWLMDAKTFSGKRMKRKQCYANAAHLALDGHGTYVEGFVSCHGVHIQHAFIVDASGNVVDPTIRPHAGIKGYYGIPFTVDYLRRTILKNAVYGLLDYWNLDILKSTDTKWKAEGAWPLPASSTTNEGNT